MLAQRHVSGANAGFGQASPKFGRFCDIEVTITPCPICLCSSTISPHSHLRSRHARLPSPQALHLDLRLNLTPSLSSVSHPVCSCSCSSSLIPTFVLILHTSTHPHTPYTCSARCFLRQPGRCSSVSARQHEVSLGPPGSSTRCTGATAGWQPPPRLDRRCLDADRSRCRARDGVRRRGRRRTVQWVVRCCLRCRRRPS